MHKSLSSIYLNFHLQIIYKFSKMNSTNFPFFWYNILVNNLNWSPIQRTCIKLLFKEIYLLKFIYFNEHFYLVLNQKRETKTTVQHDMKIFRIIEDLRESPTTLTKSKVKEAHNKKDDWKCLHQSGTLLMKAMIQTRTFLT